MDQASVKCLQEELLRLEEDRDDQMQTCPGLNDSFVQSSGNYGKIARAFRQLKDRGQSVKGFLKAIFLCLDA